MALNIMSEGPKLVPGRGLLDLADEDIGFIQFYFAKTADPLDWDEAVAEHFCSALNRYWIGYVLMGEKPDVVEWVEVHILPKCARPHTVTTWVCQCRMRNYENGKILNEEWRMVKTDAGTCRGGS